MTPRAVLAAPAIDPEPFLAPLRPLAGRSVAVALSGGVDSAVVAWLLASVGARAVGLCLRLSDAAPGDPKAERACCAPDDLQDARRIAEAVGIPFYVLDAREAFQADVVGPFVDEYLAGRTPNPCVRCNGHVKLGLLDRRARAIGAERLATGHYARIEATDGGLRLGRARDAAKDQTYFLFGVPSPVLQRLVLPLGDATKAEVRALAALAGLPVAHKLESQEVCFVGGHGAAAFVERQAAARGLDGAGRVVGPDGQALGAHDGYFRYTIGQRRGLGVAAGARLYVLGVDPGSREVRVGADDQLLRRSLVASGVRYLGAAPERPFAAHVKIRSRDPGTPALVHPAGDRARVEFEAPVRAVAPGQAAVFYVGDAVVGGGTIDAGGA